MSLASARGCSSAAKWPPTGISVHLARKQRFLGKSKRFFVAFSALARAIPMGILALVTLRKENALTIVSALVVVPIVCVLGYGFGAILYATMKRTDGLAKDDL
jgi:hypothetical protein